MSQTLTGSRVALTTMYRDEYIAGFERGGSLLRNCVTTEYMKSGSAIVFLVSDSGSATATTRGSDGQIPARVNNNNQTTITLVEKNDLVRMNNFDIFTSQGPQREIMYKTSQQVLARTIDDQILTALDTGTLAVSASAQTDALGMFHHASAALGNNNAGQKSDGEHTAVISYGFYVNLLKTKEFASREYVDGVKLVNGLPTPMKFERFLGVNILVHNGLSGVNTSAEKCFMFHRDAVGHAIDKDTLTPEFGYDAEQNYSWCRCTGFMQAAKLQNTGIIEMLHDATGYATATAS